MRARGFLAGVVLALALAQSAQAMTVASPDPRYQQWADAAFVPTPHLATLTVDLAPCPDIGGACTGTDAVIYANAAFTSSAAQARGDFLHELGHLFDYTAPRLDRPQFLRIMRDKRPWRWAPNSPHEQFAEGYALCGLGGKRARRYGFGGYDFNPNRKQMKAVCRLIRSTRAG